MISKKRLFKKLDEIKFHMKQSPQLTERLIESTKEMIQNSEDKTLIKKLVHVCIECTKDGYDIGTNEQKQNRRNTIRTFLRKQTPRLEKQIKEML